MSCTPNELIVLNNIALNSYQPTNYSRPDTFEDTSDIWSSFILDSSATEKVAVKALPGICSSLGKKGLTVSRKGTHNSQDPGTIRLTPAGFDAWFAAFPPQEVL